MLYLLNVFFFNTTHNFFNFSLYQMVEMSLNGNKWYHNSYKYSHTVSLPIIIYDLQVPYFVTEVIFGQTFINLLQQNAYN